MESVKKREKFSFNFLSQKLREKLKEFYEISKKEQLRIITEVSVRVHSATVILSAQLVDCIMKQSLMNLRVYLKGN